MLPKNLSFFRGLHETIYLRLFPNYERELKKLIGTKISLLDVGCGSRSPIEPFAAQLESVGVDSHVPSLLASEKLQIHKKYIQADVLDIDKHFAPKSFDIVFASDLIEHLTKEQGFALLQKMESIARKRVIVYTPSGFMPQGDYDNNPLQRHLSGWEADEMKRLGYRVVGINGWKKLRTDYAQLKYRPVLFWHFVSDLSQRYTRGHPAQAGHILCYKDL